MTAGDSHSDSHSGAPGASESSNVVGLYRETFGAYPDGVWSSPGRVNLIGEHTDYNQGLVLPFAIDGRARVAAGLTDDGVVAAVSAQQDTALRTRALDELDPSTATLDEWAAYVFGVVWVLRQHGLEVPGLRIALDSTVPVGAGLSSSAALECATALAVSELIGAGLDRPTLARYAQQAENDYVGVPCGLMDQMASAACTRGHLLFFDIRSGEIEQVPFDPAAQDLAVLIVDTRVKHALTDGAYANRRAACDRAAAELGVPSLRELTPDDLPRMQRALSSELYRRARHVVTEIARVRETLELLRAGAIRDIGPLMVASHQSLRDDYEVSDPALDIAVDAAMAAGAIGARMTGGGFGGSAIALIPADQLEPISAAVLAAFADAGSTPVLRTATPSAGARREPLFDELSAPMMAPEDHRLPSVVLEGLRADQR